MIAPSGGDAARATFAGPAPVPTKSNPIVGRIAFWADDDTCKLNINTASQGSFWDTPRANTYSEQRLSLSIPVQNEFQRIAGHPATTSLSPIFASLMPAPNAAAFITTSSFNPALLRSSEYSKAIDYFRLTPRINGSSSDKSSQFGLQRTAAGSTHANVWPTSGPDGPLSFANKAAVDAFGISLDSDRLYATSDELLFDPERSLNNGSFSAVEIAKRDFFLTAQSRAPETTLFGTPRLSLWPLNTTDAAGTKDRTVKDRLIAFCSTVGTLPYFFDRVVGDGYEAGATGSMSPTSDINRDRNSKLLTYLQKLTGAPLPGFGGSFSSKWGGADTVIAQAIDTIRTTNADYVDFGTGPARVIYRYGAKATNPRAEAKASWGEVLDFSGKPRGFVSPTVLPSGARGAGRSLTFAGFTIVIMPCEVVNTYTSNVTLSNNSTWTGTATCDGTSVVYNPALPSGATFPNNPPNPSSQQTTKARAFLLVQPFNATPGGANVAPGLQMEVTGSLSIGGTSLGTGTSRFGAMPQERNYAMQTTSFTNPQYLFFLCGATVGHGPDSKDNILTKMPAPAAGDLAMPPIRGTLNTIDHYYPYVTPAFDVSSGSFSFGGGNLTITLKDWTGAETLQTFTVNFPATPSLPAPQHMTNNGRHFAQFGTMQSGPWDTGGGSFDATADAGNFLSLWKRMRLNGDGNRFAQGIIRPGDIALGVQVAPDVTPFGDLRLVSLQSSVPSSWFTPVPGYPSGSAPAPFGGNNANVTSAQIDGRYAHNLRNDYINLNVYAHTAQFYGTRNNANVEVLTTSATLRGTTFLNGLTMGAQTLPVASAGLTGGFKRAGGAQIGDWGSGFGTYKDGAVFARPEPGLQTASLAGFFQDRGLVGYNVTSGSTFEPNRMVPSAGILGGIITPNSGGSLQAWQTLLANPVPAGSSHPGLNNPPDHAFLDNFWMPIVEPYAISEPLSTAGKVNLNTQILPFTHINRDTALRGAVRPLMVSSLQNAWATGNAGYKFANWNDAAVLNENVRRPLDVAETMKSFGARFSTGQFYRTATEATTSAFIPQGETFAGINSFWSSSRDLTSDTLREQPYTALLSRVTTKSNTFTVHYRVQALRQAPRPGRNWAEWVEGQDQVVGEYRGSTTIERFLDPNEPNIPDYTQVNLSGNYDPIDRFYRWRVLSQKQFAP